MKASEYIQKLQSLVAKHGDLDMCTVDNCRHVDIIYIDYSHHEYPSGSEDAYFLTIPKQG